MAPATVQFTSDGKLVGPNGQMIYQSAKPYVLKDPNGKEVLLTKSCCSLIDKSCCLMDTQPVIITINAVGDLVGPNGEMILRSRQPYIINGPSGETVYQHATSGTTSK